MNGAWAIRSDGIEDDGGDGPGRNDAEKRGSERAAHESEGAVVAGAGHG